MKGKCINLDDNCPNFNKIIEVSDDQDFVCPKCGHPLYEVEDGPSGSGGHKRLVIIVSAVVAVILVAVFIWFYGHGDKIQSETPESGHSGNIDPIERCGGKDTPSFEPEDGELFDTVVITKVDTLRTEVKDIEYSFGYYVGETLNNKPNGKGTMYFTKRATIPSRDKLKIYSAKPGYRVSGLWDDGYIMPGTGQVYDTGRKDESGNELFVYAL